MRRLLRAPNPGPMTLEGTNTWLVGARRVLVVDPGPADDGHVDQVLAEVARDGGRLGAVLLTHRHHDHSDALTHPVLRRAVEAARVPVLALDGSLGAAPDPLTLATACDEPVRVLPLPGHTDDSLGLVLPERREVCTGDTVLGRGTSVVAHPDGDLTSYLASLTLLQDLVADGPWVGLPGHGPVVADLAPVLVQLVQHRRSRIGQVVRALRSLGRSDLEGAAADDRLVDDVVGLVYPELTDPVLLGAAGRTVRATLVHLQHAGGVDR